VRRAAVAIVVLGSLALPLFALADRRLLHDANDAKGRLDVRRVEFDGHRKPRWKVVTWSGWSARTILDRGYVLVRLDSFGSGRFDYYALLRSIGGHMTAGLFHDRRGHPDYRVSSLKVWRPGRRSVKVRIRLNKLRFGASRRYYRWAVETIFSGRHCRNTCFDNAPGHGAVKEPLPGVTPSPSPSPTPTPTSTASP
jgi:hypothetical protein